jgi:hypothetical protein
VYPYYGTSPFVCMERYSAVHYLAILVSLSARDMPLILIMTDCFLSTLWLTGDGSLRQRNRALILSLGLGTLQAQTPVNSHGAPPRLRRSNGSLHSIYSTIRYNKPHGNREHACISQKS